MRRGGTSAQEARPPRGVQQQRGKHAMPRCRTFLPVKMSMATKAHLAWPCLPVLEVETSATCLFWGDGAAE